MHGVTPLADAARRLDVSCGNRRAARTARTRGLAAGEATDVSRTGTHAAWNATALEPLRQQVRVPPLLVTDRIEAAYSEPSSLHTVAAAAVSVLHSMPARRRVRCRGLIIVFRSANR